MKLILSLLCLIGMPVWLSAQSAQPESTTAEAQAPKTDPMAILAAVRKDLTGLEAMFVQYELSENQQRIDPNTGMVWMQSPDKFRWHYKDPVEQLIVADGENVWVYDEDLEQVTVKKQDNELNPIYVIINDEKSQQHYDIKHEMFKEGIDWLSLTPKARNEEVKSVWLAVNKDVITQIKVHNNFGQTMVFEFSEIKKNPGSEDGLFVFVPPEGVDVIKAVDE